MVKKSSKILPVIPYLNSPPKHFQSFGKFITLSSIATAFVIITWVLTGVRAVRLNLQEWKVVYYEHCNLQEIKQS